MMKTYIIHFKHIFLISIIILFQIKSINAITYQISVGQNGQLVFQPSTITIAVGDTIQFKFFGTHTATHASVSDPCTKASPSMFDFSSDGQQIFNTTGVFNFFCAIPGHCQAGMKGVITVSSTLTNTSSTTSSKSSGTSSKYKNIINILILIIFIIGIIEFMWKFEIKNLNVIIYFLY